MHEIQPQIAVYLRSLYNGGTDQVMLNLICEFVKHGLKVDLVLDFCEFSPYLNQFPPEVNIVKLGAYHTLERVPKLINYLQQNRPLSLLTAGFFTNVIAVIASRLASASTRVVVTEHNSPTINKKLMPFWRPHYWFSEVARWTYPWADGIVAVSQGTAEDMAHLMKLPLERIQTIYNPIITSRLTEQAQVPVDHPWFAPGEPPVILGIGRLEPQKNFLNLVTAFAQVRKIRPAKLMILGEGSEREQIKARVHELGIADDVALPGFVQNPHAYTARAAVFVLSSIWEGLSNVLIEALAIGTPAIATDCNYGPSEVLDSGRYGELVPVGDSEALAQAILKVLSGRKKEIDARWLDQFTVEYAAQQYLKVLGVTGCEATSNQGYKASALSSIV
jgi:glycosyltransferase involved in cell wall biosynthesis